MSTNFDKSFMQRMDQLIDHMSSGNLREFCSTYNLNYATWTSVVKKHGNPRLELIEELIHATGVDVTWLITGKGEMFSHHKKNDISSTVDSSVGDVSIYRSLYERERDRKEELMQELAVAKYELTKMKEKLKG